MYNGSTEASSIISSFFPRNSAIMNPALANTTSAFSAASASHLSGGPATTSTLTLSLAPKRAAASCMAGAGPSDP